MALKVGDISISSTTAKAVLQLNSSPSTTNDTLAALGLKPVLTALPQTKFEKFFNNQPKIFFTCDYIVDEKNIGALLVFQRYPEATHYEVFKKNKFDNNPKFERILFLTSEAFEAETQKLLPYLETTGFSFNENAIFIMLDDSVKKDRIYEYFIRAVLVPTKVEDFSPDEILRSKQKIGILNPPTQEDLLNLLDWTSGFFNREISFFKNTEPQLSDLNKQFFILKESESFVKLINDAFYLFGLKKTMFRLINLLNRQQEKLNKEVEDAFDSSVDETRGIFSFSKFKIEIAKTSGVALLETGSISFGSFDGLKKIFETLKSVNNVIISGGKIIKTNGGTDSAPTAESGGQSQPLQVSTSQGGVSSTSPSLSALLKNE